jgi:hypothetical protein
MGAAVTGAPHADAVGGELRARLGVGDRVAVVADLLPGVDLLARLAVAGAEIAVVEHQRPQPPGGERLGEVVQVHFLDRGEAVGHDDGGDRAAGLIGEVQPAPQGHTFGVELDVLSHGSSSASGLVAGCDGRFEP